MAKNIWMMALAAGLLAGCGDVKSDSSAAPATSPIPAPAPTVARPVAASDEGFTASGPLIVEHQLEISAQREGVVSKICLLYTSPSPRD